MHIGANIIIRLLNNFRNNFVTVNLGLQLFIFGILFVYCTLVLANKGATIVRFAKNWKNLYFKEYAYSEISTFLVKIYEPRYFMKSIWVQNVLISIVHCHLPKKIYPQFGFTVLLSMKFTLLDSLFFMFVALKVKWLLSAYLSQEVQIEYSDVNTGVRM